MLATNPLISVTPGLMIWTIVCFAITFFVLRKYAFGPIQQMIDARRERIEQAISEADHARDEARHLLEEHRKLIGQAKSEAEEILSDRQRRLEETRRQIEQATHHALGQIREEVGRLSLLAAEKVTRKSLTDADQRRLIDEALAEIDFSELEGSRS
jgi:F-type H+-transporting ATPase subunit b